MKKTSVLAFLLIPVLLFGSCSVKTESETETAPLPDSEPAVETASAPIGDPAREESVYVISSPDGTPLQTIVTESFTGVTGDDAKAACAELSSLEAVKGDFCYRGETDNALPVTMHITYTLDDTPIDPEALAGKSGHLVMTVTYQNDAMTTVTVNNTSHTVHVPFTVVTGTLLDNAVFQNITVQGGQLLQDGDKAVAVGLAFPGLEEDLGLTLEAFSIPSSMTLEADVKDFKLETVFSFMTPSLLGSLDESLLSKLDGLSLPDEITQLTSAIRQLSDGSGSLYEGLENLTAGVDKLTGGIGTLYNGLSTLNENSDALVEGADKVLDTLLATANDRIAEAGLEAETLTADNYSALLTGLLTKLDSAGSYAESAAREKVTAAVRAQSDTVREKVTEAVKTQVTEAVQEAAREKALESILSPFGDNVADYEAGIAAGTVSAARQAVVNAALNIAMRSDDVQSQINSAIEEQMASEKVQSVITQKTEEQIQSIIEEKMVSDEVQSQIMEATQSVSDGAVSLRTLKQNLDSFMVFYNGIKAYTAGVASAAEGAGQIASNLPALESGADQLKDGAKSLSEGMKLLEDKITEALSGLTDTDLSGLTDKLKALYQASTDYNAFTSLPDGIKGSTKFILRTKAIG